MATALKSTFAPTVAAPAVRLKITDRPGNKPETEPEDAIFSKEDIAWFRSQDAEAGGFVAKALCTMFAWSVFILSFVVWWTYRTV